MHKNRSHLLVPALGSLAALPVMVVMVMVVVVASVVASSVTLVMVVVLVTSAAVVLDPGRERHLLLLHRLRSRWR